MKERAAELKERVEAKADEVKERVGAKADEVRELLAHFVEHANAHFLSEKILMRNSAYAAYEQHVMEHDLLLSTADGFLRSVRDGEVADARSFVASLRNWLVVHMNTTDAAFESFLERQMAAEGRGDL
jgi:hemerythrin-like metal-binding protein